MNLMQLFRKPAQQPTEAGPDAPAIDDDSLPCGWFDSSHDLRRGLVVIECDGTQAWPDTLPCSWPLRGVPSSAQA